jgi:S-adenosylmethionine:tRNA ribosyltransferase-isomerase
MSAQALPVPAPPMPEANEPPEARGLARHDVRMLVSRADGSIEHARVRDLTRVLAAGDLLVVNTSGTLPAALHAAREDGTRLQLHLSAAVRGGRDGLWLAELRRGGAGFGAGRAGERLDLPGGASARLLAPDPRGRLWVCDLEVPGALLDYLGAHGHPIRYAHSGVWPLEAYQTAFALEPGSVEMPSAARPLTPSLTATLVAHGILLAPIVLHAGVSSLERGERPHPERYRVPAATARLVTATRRWGSRVVAVGTTVVRALETVAEPGGTIRAGDGWTDLVVTPERGVRSVDGLLTGWHDPDSSHLQLLEAVAGRHPVERAYAVAAETGYRRHEFGDSHLLLR